MLLSTGAMYRYLSPTTDANFASVVFLSGFEGADGSTTFDDESTSNHTLTAVGDAQIDTAQFKYGSSAALFDGTGDQITAPDHANFTFGAAEFTVELFVRFSGLPGNSGAFCGQWGALSANQSWYFFLTSSSLIFRMIDSGGTTRDTSVGWVPSLNTWYHLAVDRDAANKFRIYQDGVMTASATFSQTMRDGTGLFGIGAIPGFLATGPMNGWIDELRITKGVARYASDGGFTVPTAAYPRTA